MLIASLALAGCGGADPPPFRLNMEGRAADDFEDATLQQISVLLTAAFGTPDDPFVFEETGLDMRKLRMAAGPAFGNEDGSQRGLYRQHCAHCHGISGDGAGPTAAFLVPYPRDYRQGKFKFKSTQRPSKPTDEDLKRVLVQGVPGTAMPSFRLLPEDELEALVEYVKYLSLRGEVETHLFLMADDDELPTDRETLVSEAIEPYVNFWNDAEKQIIAPPAPPELNEQQLLASIEQGRQLYHHIKAQCAQCHGPTALGDDPELRFDDWNKEKNPREPGLWLLPRQRLQARNLRLGIYRGGRRPVDLYRRIHAGVNGTPMPELQTSLSPEEIWHLVHYVQALPYERVGQQPSHEATALRLRH